MTNRRESVRAVLNFAKPTWLTVALLASLLARVAGAEGEAEQRFVLDKNGTRAQPRVVIENVCAWPNLSVLRDGTIIATIHNQPSHLRMPADVACWASTDGGQTWTMRGMPAPRDNERVARGNVAAGVARNGDLIVITSGWADPASPTRSHILPPLVSRSSDQGRSWSIDADAFPDKWPERAESTASPQGYLVPFGDILQGADGKLRAAFYGNGPGCGFVFSSADDGKTWSELVAIDEESVIHEPALFHLGEGRWLAASRDDGLDLYASDDEGQTWSRHSKLTGPQQHPGHFTRLKNGTLLLTYGNRLDPKGVDVRFSEDEGTTWSKPIRVMEFQRDGGYPSSVELPDGQVLTAYYAQQIAGYDQYHMGVVVWDPARTRDR